MIIEDKLIPGIHNFCDSWCERCLFTERCRSYQVQTEGGLQSTGSKATLVQQLTEAVALTKRYLDTTRTTSVPNDLSTAKQHELEQTVFGVAPEKGKHPLAQLSQAYLHQTGDWLGNEKGLLEQAGYQQLYEVKLGIRTENEALEQLNALKDAWQLIKWYRTLVAIKTASALRLFGESTDDNTLKNYYAGKAKLVLVSIDRSLLAWQTIMIHFPEKIDELLGVLALLNRISRELETLFPDARAFKRPGLDS